MSRPSNSQTSTREQRLVFLKWDVLDAWRKSRGLTEAELCEKHHVGKETYRRIKRGDGVEISTAGKFADAMGLTDVRELLVEDASALPLPIKPDQRLMVDEWDAVEPLTDWIKASNGLQYRIFKMQNRFSPEQLARGKCYELDGVYDRERERVDACFTRHSEICRRVGPHSNLPVCYRSSPDPTGRFWWIIDSWPSGRLLAEQLTGQRFDGMTVKSLMLQIGQGLSALHGVNIVRRELAPRNIVFNPTTGRVVLTDFELGKLLDSSITVSKGAWPVDRYRAPEVGKGRATVRADIHSWGRLFVEAATGTLPINGQEEASLKRLILPRGLRELVLSCVDLIPDNRPTSIDPVLKALSNWA